MIRTIFPVGLSPAEIASLHVSIRSAAAEVETKNGGQFEASFEILMDDRPAFHNGLATVIPRNFIWVYSAPPQNNSSIGVSPDYIHSTLVHEMGHMFYLQKRRGIFRTGSRFFGNLSSPLGAWPRWMHEGWATWTEGRFTLGHNLAYLNFIKRTYAEYAAKNANNRLTNSMLEGSSPLQLTESGEIPYAFGASMLQKVFLKITPEDWAQSSAESLGISFRKSATRNGFAVQQVFEETELEWRQEPLVINSGKPTPTLLYTASTLDALSDHLLIEREEKQTRVVDFANPEQPRRLPWRYQHWYLTNAAKTADPHVFIAAFYTAPRTGRSGTRLRIGRFSADDNYPSLVHICTIFESDTFSIESLNTDAEGKTTATLNSRAPDQGSESLQSIIILSQDCSVSQENMVKPRLTQTPFDTQTWQLNDGRHETWRLRNLVNPRLVTNTSCKSIFGVEVSVCLSGIHNTPAFRNPIIAAHTNQAEWLIKSYPVATGAQDVSLNENGLVWIEKHWEDDQLLRLSFDQLREIKTQPMLGFQKVGANSIAPPQIKANITKVSTTSYSPWSGMWPQYWMPRLYATQGGVIISGTAWFHDITKTHEGSFDLGYDTVSRSPYVQASLQKKVGDNLWPQSTDVSFSYLRDTTWGINIDQGAIQLGASGTIPTGGSANIVPRLFATGKWTSISGNSKYFLIPALSLAWQYRQATSPSNLNVDHSNHEFGLLVYARGSWIKNYEAYAETALSNAWPLSWVLHLEYGNTSRRNLPYSYFEWGGAYPLTLSQPTFLSRGFAPRSAASTTIVRAALTTGWTWSHRMGGLGWSRFEIERLSQDIFAESVSLDGLRARGPRLGKNFYTSVGTELNFWLRSLFYLKSRAYVGVYQGFGAGAETRVGVGLASNLDI